MPGLAVAPGRPDPVGGAHRVPGAALGHEALGLTRQASVRRAPRQGTKENAHIPLSLPHFPSPMVPHGEGTQGEGETCFFPSSPDSRASHHPMLHTRPQVHMLFPSLDFHLPLCEVDLRPHSRDLSSSLGWQQFQ